MNSGDLNKVWEIKTLKRKGKEEQARNILERISKQVQPIMRKHQWRVKLLSEFYPKNGSLLGLNVGRGIHVKLRLRRSNREEEFFSFNEILDTIFHELCHNVHGPHHAGFYKLWDEIRKECEDLMSNGISGSEQGFDLPGRRLGGIWCRPPLSCIGQTAAAAAEKRAQLGSLLCSGPKRLGGDSSIMCALSPIQAAAMAAERRLKDNIWCGSEHYDASEDDESADFLTKPCDVEDGSRNSQIHSGLNAQASNNQSRKRARLSDSNSSTGCSDYPTESDLISSNKDTSVSASRLIGEEISCRKKYRTLSKLHTQSSDSLPKSNFVDLTCDASISKASPSQDISRNTEKSAMWECTLCTLMNPPLAPVCGVCGSKGPEDAGCKYKSWSCKFCTLDNVIELEKCSACGEWRYSHGPPVATRTLNLGT